MEPLATTAVFTTVVVAVVEAIQATADRKWRVVATIAGAGVAGGVLGALGVIPGVGVVAGAALGLSASGVVTIAQKV